MRKRDSMLRPLHCSLKENLERWIVFFFGFFFFVFWGGGGVWCGVSVTDTLSLNPLHC